MKSTCWFLLGLLFILGLVRVFGYFVYAMASLPFPFETFHLEAKMVLLAYRVELGVTLYPAWRDYPHVSNFFGPVYFGVVGLVGWIQKADIPGLFRIGRTLSFASGLLTTLVVGVTGGRRYGFVAGTLGATLSLAAAPMIGFSVMVRPDMMAELLGIGGFFLVGNRTWWGRLAGGGLLVLATLTKQTALVFLLAAALASAAEHDWRGSLRLFAGVLVVLASVVGLVTLVVEPNFARSLVGESKSPWDLGSLVRMLVSVLQSSPDLIFFPLLGLWVWTSKATGEREVRLAILASVLLVTSIGLASKRGADLNYYLSLRVVEGLAVGAIFKAVASSLSRKGLAVLSVLLVAGCVTMVPGIRLVLRQAQFARAGSAFLEGPYGRDVLTFYGAIKNLARDPKTHLLTDSGLIDLYQGKRAAFGDPWLFRLLEETGQVSPNLIRDRIESQYYDLIITTSELENPTYASYEFGLPMPLVERARARYVRIQSRAGLFLYGRVPAR